MIKEIAFTVYAVTNMKKARAFYEGKLGLVPGKEFNGPSWVEYPVGPDGTFAVGYSEEWKPSKDGAVIAFEVDNFKEFVAKLKKQKVPFRMEGQDFPTCHMAVVKDPDGNRVIIHQRKAK